MSVALDYYSYTEAEACEGSGAALLAPVEPLPDDLPIRIRPDASPRRLASVSVLRAPRESDAVRPLRLTRRGVVVLALLVAAVGGALVWIAALSAPSAPAASPMPASVTVQAGDTVWSIASRYAPNSDPAAVVASIEHRNHLADAQLVPGQVLRLR